MTFESFRPFYPYFAWRPQFGNEAKAKRGLLNSTLLRCRFGLSCLRLLFAFLFSKCGKILVFFDLWMH